MTHSDVLYNFKRIFPNLWERIEVWYPNGRNSVRVRFTGWTECTFTYFSPTDWKFETLHSFVKTM